MFVTSNQMGHKERIHKNLPVISKELQTEVPSAFAVGAVVVFNIKLPWYPGHWSETRRCQDVVGNMTSVNPDIWRTFSCYNGSGGYCATTKEGCHKAFALWLLDGFLMCSVTKHSCLSDHTFHLSIVNAMREYSWWGFTKAAEHGREHAGKCVNRPEGLSRYTKRQEQQDLEVDIQSEVATKVESPNVSSKISSPVQPSQIPSLRSSSQSSCRVGGGSGRVESQVSQPSRSHLREFFKLLGYDLLYAMSL
ncbi:hypothetical protein ARMSODRAFT_975089 [Armillaria solidipes]|uniref:Uncharacterized protein n=1 Tax=Armillaria solidipes TaxID=1076256 RepID=A0A2H3BXN4_9AGAR|nr:hypothetical protein ARMSODRAFT_975089 [Armillaria solidipes]